VTPKEQVLAEAPDWTEEQAAAAIDAAHRLARPDTSLDAILARHGERRLTPAEFERHFGSLPRDGEG
jgi:hypothetical protein